MARTLTGIIKAGLSLVYQGDLDLGAQKATLPFPAEIVIGSGTGSGQSDLAYFDQRPLAGATTEDLDLRGGLTDAFGQVLNFIEVTAIYIKAGAANNGDLVVGGDGAAAFLGPFDNATDKVNIGPGQTFLVTNTTTGWPTTAGTADLLQVQNEGAGAATYDICIIGRSA